MTLDRRLHQKRPQIQSEIVDRALVGRIGQRIAQLALHARRDQAIVCVLGSGADKGSSTSARLEDRPAQADERLLAVGIDGNLQKALALAAVEGENLVALHLADRLGEVKIHPIDRARLLLLLGDG